MSFLMFERVPGAHHIGSSVYINSYIKRRRVSLEEKHETFRSRGEERRHLAL